MLYILPALPNNIFIYLPYACYSFIHCNLVFCEDDKVTDSSYEISSSGDKVGPVNDLFWTHDFI